MYIVEAFVYSECNFIYHKLREWCKKNDCEYNVQYFEGDYTQHIVCKYQNEFNEDLRKTLEDFGYCVIRLRISTWDNVDKPTLYTQNYKVNEEKFNVIIDETPTLIKRHPTLYEYKTIFDDNIALDKNFF